MKDKGMEILEEDAALAKAVRAAFDAGEVPASLRARIRAAAPVEWNSLRRRRRQRMHRWLSGLTSMAAAAMILMYSGTQYFGVSGTRPEAESFRNLDRIMDLVSLSYPAEDLTDEELAALALPAGSEITRDSVAARVDDLLTLGEDDYFGGE